MRNFTDADLEALAALLQQQDQTHCSFSEEERVIIKKFVKFLDRTAAKIGTIVILAILGSLAALWAQMAGR